jgi:DNA-binding MurR/RpiR family transcriptional regulator
MTEIEHGEALSADALLARLRSTHTLLSPKLAKAAGYLIERPDEIAFTSMRQMADRAGVQPAIMVRLAQRLGFGGYEALREPFRTALHHRAAGLGQRARDLQARIRMRGGGKPLTGLANELIALERENLAATLDSIGGDRLAAASRTLVDAEVIYLAGQRSLFSVAHYMREVVAMFRHDVVLLDGVGSAYGDALRPIGPRDTLLAISFDPHPPGTIEAARFARRRGAAIIAVTDRDGSPLADLAGDLLTVVSQGPGLVPSAVAAIAIVQVLANQMLAQGGQTALEAIAATEEQFAGLDRRRNDSRDMPQSRRS